MLQHYGPQLVNLLAAVMLLRKRAPEMRRPYRIWLYPVPCFIALAGWLFLFATSGRMVWYGLGTLVLGVIFFLAWSWRTRRWPFDTAVPVVTSSR